MLELASDPRQLFILVVSFSVPLWLIFKNKERWLLAWICLTATIQLFDAKIIINLPAGRVAGLMLLPQVLRSLPSIIGRSIPGRAVIAQYSCLVLTGVVFGFIFPWPSSGFDRSFNQMPQGRTIIFLIRSAADMGITFFVARQIIKWKCTDQILKIILFGISVTALAGIFEFTTRIDLLEVFSGLSYNNDGLRVRGFNYEPRSLGLIATYGFLLATVLLSYNRSWKMFILVGLCGTALFISGSTSAMVALVIGILGLILYARRHRIALIGVLLVTTLALGYLSISENAFNAYLLKSSQWRLQETRFDETATSFMQALAFRMEIFDGPALLFLTSNPIYLLSGTGPGLISLPATAYMPFGIHYTWLDDTGINSPPTMGLLLEVSNIGVAGLLLWFIICVSSFRAFNRLARHYPDEREKWLAMRAVFVVGSAVYCVQNSPLSAIWAIFVGTGVAASYLVSIEKYNSPHNLAGSIKSR